MDVINKPVRLAVNISPCTEPYAAGGGLRMSGLIESRILNVKAVPDLMCEFIDYKTSMITDEDPLRGVLYLETAPVVCKDYSQVGILGL